MPEFILVITLAIVVTILSCPRPALSRSFKIGAILHNPHDESAVRFAVEYANKLELLGSGHQMEFSLNETDSIVAFENIQATCSLAEEGIMAIIGPLSSSGTKAVSPVSRALHIPLIAPVSTDPLLGLKNKHPNLVRMMAPDSVQSQALVSLVQRYGWTKMAILTSDTDYGVNGLVELQEEAARQNWQVTSVLRFPVGGANAAIDVTNQLSIIKESGVRVIILNCLSSFGVQVLDQARDRGMTSQGWAWVVTDGMTGEVFFEPGAVVPHYQGLIGSRPATGHGALWEDARAQWLALDPEQYAGAGKQISAYKSYLMDAVLLVAYAIRAMLDDGHSSLEAAHLSCGDDHQAKWEYGDTLLHYMSEVNEEGIASRIVFRDDLSPLEPVFDIVNLDRYGWQEVGNWTPDSKTLTLDSSDVRFMGNAHYVDDYISNLVNKTLRAVTIVEAPFVIIANENLDPTNIQPGDLEGFCIDILDKLVEMIGFQYTLYLVKDGKFGSKDQDTKQWNGMVKDLVDRDVDIAPADLTINYAREQDIDYTTPFLDLGMSFVMKKEEAEKSPPFRFLDPFSDQVWMFVLITTFLVAIVVSILNKLSPYDHHGEFVYKDFFKANVENDYKQYKKLKKLKIAAVSEMNFSNSTWFAIASFLQQGGEAYPKSYSARLTAILWWFVIVIIISTYTANLAAFLTASRKQTEINSIEDLGVQAKVEYGTVGSSAPHQYFIDSQITLYSDMKNFMDTRHTLVSETSEGIKKAREGGYAFIWDSAVLDYSIEQKPCNTLKTVGRIFGKIGYGFGLQKNSPYREELSTYILQMRETGFMDDLKRKWYQERGECQSSSSDDSEEAQEIADAGGTLNIMHMLGVFYIIYGGLVLSIIVLILEWFVECALVVDKNDPLSPHSLRESFSRRFKQMCKDFREHSSCLQRCCPAAAKDTHAAENGILEGNGAVEGHNVDGASGSDEGYHEMTENGSLKSKDANKSSDLLKKAMVLKAFGVEKPSEDSDHPKYQTQNNEHPVSQNIIMQNRSTSPVSNSRQQSKKTKFTQPKVHSAKTLDQSSSQQELLNGDILGEISLVPNDMDEKNDVSSPTNNWYVSSLDSASENEETTEVEVHQEAHDVPHELSDETYEMPIKHVSYVYNGLFEPSRQEKASCQDKTESPIPSTFTSNDDLTE